MYGYWKGGTPARVFSQTVAQRNRENEIRQRNRGRRQAVKSEN